MLKRKLLKQALPILLSAAMIFQSMPATALAAETTETTEAVKGEESSQKKQQIKTKPHQTVGVRIVLRWKAAVRITPSQKNP